MNSNREDRYSRRRSRLNVPQRGISTPASIRSAQHDQDDKLRAEHSPSKSIDISINFDSLPKFSDIPWITLPTKEQVITYAQELTFAQRAMIVASVVVIAVIGTLAGSFLNRTSADGTDPAKVSKAPDYQTVIPDGKSISELGGWKRISPPGGAPVYAYSDKIDNVPVSVSQQSLPDSFTGDSDGHVADVAKKFNATTKIEAGDTTVYLGTSAKGPQSVIFAKKDLLILIKSKTKIDDKSWATYVKSLNYLQKPVPNY